jgi:ornithine cyclodeaminase
MGPVFVEYEPQTRVEGELQNMPENFAATPFWKVLHGLLPGRTDPGQITIFDSVGFALEDYSALRYVRDMAGKLGLGRALTLVPRLDDPKDVFSLTRAGTKETRDAGEQGAAQPCEKEAMLPSA